MGFLVIVLLVGGVGAVVTVFCLWLAWTALGGERVR